VRFFERRRTLPERMMDRPMATLSDLDRVRGAQGAAFASSGRLSGSRRAVYRALVDVPSVQPVSALATGFRGRRSCGPEFGRTGDGHG
jgi:hypothetical protein